MATTNDFLNSLQRREHYLPATALNADDEERLQYLRGAARDTRRKIEDLESELYNKEKAYEAELSLRKSLEQRLSSRLVDMYNNTEVNSEINQRLPRSQSHRPFTMERFDDQSISYRPFETTSSQGGLLMTTPGMAAPLVLSPVSLPYPTELAPDRHESRQLSSLLSELEAVKDENRRLQTRLVEAQKDSETSRHNAENAKTEVEALVAAQVADMVKDIHAAQKSRDEAMMVRLRIANDERDAALSRLHETEALQNDAEKEIKPQNNQQVESNRFMSPTNQSPSNNVDSTEVDSLRMERDAAIRKFQQLQQDYNNLKKTNVPQEFSNNNNDGNTDFERVKSERDDALRKLSEMEDEMQTLRVYYSLHKSLSPEMASNQLGGHNSDVYRSQNVALQHRVHSLSAELDHVNRELEETKSAKAKIEEELTKMNRLVSVLRRKLTQSERHLNP